MWKAGSYQKLQVYICCLSLLSITKSACLSQTKMSSNWSSICSLHCFATLFLYHSLYTCSSPLLSKSYVSTDAVKILQEEHEGGSGEFTLPIASSRLLLYTIASVDKQQLIMEIDNFFFCYP